MKMISVENLQKHFRLSQHKAGFLGDLRALFKPQHHIVRAVDGVTFEIGAGEIVGYLGPNGAGKSTTIKMLTGLLVPTGGLINVNGYLPWRDRTRYVANIGAVFGTRTTLWWDLPVIESLELLRYIYNIPIERYRQNLDEFRDLLDLDAFLETPVRSLSLGQRMRADLCAALLHDPILVFLDEPTVGLDVVAKERIRQFIQRINKQRGVTILLTTHDLSDVEKLCERVMIIDHGNLVYDGHLQELRQRFGGKRRLLVDFAEAYPDYSVTHASVSNVDGLRVTYEFERGSTTASELIASISQRFRIQDLSVYEPDIEETIRRIYEERLL